MTEQATSTRPSINNPVTSKGVPLPFFPIGDRVFCEKLAEDDVVTKAGLIIPGRDSSKCSFGIIVAAGPQALDVLHDVGITIGDRIIWGNYAGDPLQWKVDADDRAYHHVHVINVKDVWGCAELREKIASGDLRIENVPTAEGFTSYRFTERDKASEEYLEEFNRVALEIADKRNSAVKESV